jgi:hypothetical protein
MYVINYISERGKGDYIPIASTIQKSYEIEKCQCCESQQPVGLIAARDFLGSHNQEYFLKVLGDAYVSI